MTPIEPLRVSIIQAPLEWADKPKNLAYFTHELEVLNGTPDLIILPEMFATGFVMNPAEISEPMNGVIMQWMANNAAKYDCVIAGSIAIEEEGKYFNRLIWMKADGTFVTTDKRHLFRMGNEHQLFSAGDKPLVVELNGWRIRPLICYDLRFPVWSKNRIIDGKYEYDLMFYVANWPASRNYVWKTLLTARAIENQAYCVGVNRIGEDGKGIPHSGNSMVLDFKGRSLICGPANKPFSDTAVLDHQELSAFRERFAVGLDWDDFTINT
ncbi:MAG: carbon-nitrogen hydrolase family [Bacteroidetes bacterium]|nr:MAG: carbon-nitrogen hydrolase family [Bacteroidota bacterium]